MRHFQPRSLVGLSIRNSGFWAIGIASAAPPRSETVTDGEVMASGWLSDSVWYERNSSAVSLFPLVHDIEEY